MKLSSAQQNDLETIKYFIPQQMKKIPITDNDIKMFFENSERGLHKELVNSYRMDGFNALIQGKQWRGIHIHELYEQGILDGSMPYFVLLGGFDKKRKWWQVWKPKYYHNPMPRHVVDFIKKEIFKGKDAEIIEKCYQSILDFKN